MKLLVLITTTILLLCNNVWSQGLETFDILEPIVKISPARNEEDRFGYSVTAHQLVKLSPEDSFQKALDNTVIMVGAPDGQFPGGISGIEPNGLVCREVYPDLSDDELLALSNSEIWPCYDNITTGLVYTCPLNSGQCGATLGNGNATGPDGLLFDRVGNSEAISGNSEVFHDKNFQLMGKTVYSNGDYFVACAPLWEYVDVNVDGLLLPQPRGRCVYSNRTLTDFLILFPCNEGKVKFGCF